MKNIIFALLIVVAACQSKKQPATDASTVTWAVDVSWANQAIPPFLEINRVLTGGTRPDTRHAI